MFSWSAFAIHCSRSAGSGGGERELLSERCQLPGLRAGQLAQRLTRIGELVFRRDLPRAGEVEARLGLLHVGDGDEPYVKALLGLLQLAGDRFPFGAGEFQVIESGQHVEVILCGPHHQRLTGGLDLGLGLPDARLRLA